MIARLTVVDGSLTEYPLAEKTKGCWQNGVTFYPDEKVTKVVPLRVSAPSERVEHAAEARAVLQLAGRDVSENMALQTGEHKADMIAVAQVHATLALVEQQRIANLIALMDSPRSSTLMAKAALNGLSEGEPFAVRDLRADVREGLGL